MMQTRLGFGYIYNNFHEVILYSLLMVINIWVFDDVIISTSMYYIYLGILFSNRLS